MPTARPPERWRKGTKGSVTGRRSASESNRKVSCGVNRSRVALIPLSRPETRNADRSKLATSAHRLISVNGFVPSRLRRRRTPIIWCPIEERRQVKQNAGFASQAGGCIRRRLYRRDPTMRFLSGSPRRARALSCHFPATSVVFRVKKIGTNGILAWKRRAVAFAVHARPDASARPGPLSTSRCS